MSLRWRDRAAELPADACPTSRLMVELGFWTALVYGVFGGVRANWFDVFHWYIRGCFTSLHGAALGLALGYAQLWVLTGRRWRPEGWIRWNVLGILVGNLATSYAIEGAMRMLNFLPWEARDGAVWSLSFGILLALALAVPLWKKAWPPEARLWIAGRAALTVFAWICAMALAFIPTGRPADGLVYKSCLLAAQGILAGFLEGAGTAWLLDRLYYRPPAA